MENSEENYQCSKEIKDLLKNYGFIETKGGNGDLE